MSDVRVSARVRSYDAWYETPLGAAALRLELRSLGRHAHPTRGARALDAGCGTGRYTAWLADQGFEVTAIDADAEMLSACRLRVPTARAVEGTITDMPFADGEFDLATAVTVLCFLDRGQREAALRELVRVVRPGGRVVVGELARFSLWALQRRIKGWTGSRTWSTARFSTAAELGDLLRGAGARAVETDYALYLPPWNEPLVTRHADALERWGRHLGSAGAAFVVASATV